MWNILLKLSNRERKEKIDETINTSRKKFEEHQKKLKEAIDTFNKSIPKLYLIKDRFYRIYPISFIVFVIWLLPIIYFALTSNKNVVNFIVLIVYFIITIPIGLISLLIPLVKFIAFDLKKKVNEVKVWASAKYVIGIFFLENRILDITLNKIDVDGMIHYRKLPYMVDKSASFLTTSKLMILFYVTNIPNPLKFNFRTYIEAYAEKLRKPEKLILDFENKEVDVAFSSENLRDFKKANLFKNFFKDYVTEANKLVFALIGMVTVILIVFLVAYILK